MKEFPKKDTNRSKDVEGPKLERPEDKELKMKDSDYKEGGPLSKFSLADLHDGDHHSPLTALGKQKVLEVHPMGSDMPDHKPVLAKGSLKDQSQSSKGKGKY